MMIVSPNAKRFWESEQISELFVCMPFDKNKDNKYKIIEDTTKRLKNENQENEFKSGTELSNTEKVAIDTDDKVVNRIINAKMLFFDISKDTRTKHINLSVMHELGIARAIRDPWDIVIIRPKSESEERESLYIQSPNYNEFVEPLDEEFVQKILKEALKNQEHYKGKIVRFAAESIDDEGLYLIQIHGKQKNFMPPPIEKRDSIYRLLDLGILKLNTAMKKDEHGVERLTYSYWWTTFGNTVKKYIEEKKK
ncbi:MAG: hypothetical protein ABII22_00710 [Candidatus Micrarchaeota archaeon]